MLLYRTCIIAEPKDKTMTDAVKQWVRATAAIEVAKREYFPRIKGLNDERKETEQALLDQLLAEDVAGCVRIGDRCFARIGQKKWQDCVTRAVIERALDNVSDAHLLNADTGNLEAQIIECVKEARTKSKKVAILGRRAMGPAASLSHPVMALASRLQKVETAIKEVKEAHSAVVKKPTTELKLLQTPVMAWMAGQGVVRQQMTLSGGGGIPEVHILEQKTVTRTPRVSQKLVCDAVATAVAQMDAEDAAECRTQLVRSIMATIGAVPRESTTMLQFKKKK